MAKGYRSKLKSRGLAPVACERCGKPLRQKPGRGRCLRFCSGHCARMSWRTAKGIAKPATFACRRCGAEQPNTVTVGRRKVYCDRRCKDRWEAANR